MKQYILDFFPLKKSACLCVCVGGYIEHCGARRISNIFANVIANCINRNSELLGVKYIVSDVFIVGRVLFKEWCLDIQGLCL